jgi:hypothetical protein
MVVQLIAVAERVETDDSFMLHVLRLYRAWYSGARVFQKQLELDSILSTVTSCAVSARLSSVTGNGNVKTANSWAGIEIITAPTIRLTAAR